MIQPPPSSSVHLPDPRIGGNPTSAPHGLIAGMPSSSSTAQHLNHTLRGTAESPPAWTAFLPFARISTLKKTERAGTSRETIDRASAPSVLASGNDFVSGGYVAQKLARSCRRGRPLFPSRISLDKVLFRVLPPPNRTYGIERDREKRERGGSGVCPPRLSHSVRVL